MTKWCNNCEAYKSNWSSGYKSYSRCWSCDKWTSVSSSDKNLYDWWGNGITGDQKDKIAKFGVSTSSSNNQKYPSWTLTKLYYYDTIWERNKWKIPSKNQFIVFFSTYWNNNCMLIVSGDSNYAVNLLVYEMPANSMSEVLEKFYVEGGYSYLSTAKDKVKQVEATLKGDRPILYKGSNMWISYPSYTDYSHLDSAFNEVKKSTLYSGSIPFSSQYDMPFKKDFLGKFASYDKTYKYSEVSHLLAPNYKTFLENTNPDNYIKPFDILKTSAKTKDVIHTGIYLGNGKVYHNLFTGIILDDWKDFGVRVGHPDRMLRYHPVVAFKNPEKIREHVAKCVESGSWKFDIRENNCEHFANKCVLGLNLSEHVEMKKPERGYSQKQLNGSPSLSSETSQTNSSLDSLIGYNPSYRISKIKEHNTHHFGGIDMECSIEVSPRYSYWHNS